MVIIRATAAAIVLAGVGVGLAGAASADDRLDGDYTFTNGATTNTWTITTFCNPEVTCGGTISTSTGLVAAINRLTGGPWTVDRHDVRNGRVCADGSTAPADLLYSFDPATLIGTISTTSKPGACGDPNPLHDEQPISLVKTAGDPNSDQLFLPDPGLG